MAGWCGLCEIHHRLNSSQVCLLIINCHYGLLTSIILPTCWVTEVCFVEATTLIALILLTCSQEAILWVITRVRRGLLLFPPGEVCSLVMKCETCASALACVMFVHFLFYDKATCSFFFIFSSTGTCCE